jgi:FHA domain
MSAVNPSNLTEAMAARLGHLRLRMRRGEFAGEDGSAVGYRDVYPPGAVIGRGEDVDIRILDTDGFLSRRHLVLDAVGLQWFLFDCKSSHGSELVVGSQRIALPAFVRRPVGHDEVVVLPGDIAFSIEVIAQDALGERTKDPPSRDKGPTIGDPLAWELASLLLKSRRNNPGSTAAPTLQELAADLKIQVRSVEFRLAKLRKIDAIDRQLPRRPKLHDYADAVANVCPYLLSRAG